VADIGLNQSNFIDNTKKTKTAPRSRRAPQPGSDSDIVWGAAAIGREIGANARKAFHLLETGVLPGKKVAGRWAASKRKLAEFFEG
jgi:hypothetical protein